MAVKGRTYRVPRRVMDAVHSGLRVYTSQGVRPSEDAEALDVARSLVSGDPLELDVAERIDRFFSHDWGWDPRKTRVAGLYGGAEGRAWAEKCLSVQGLVASGEDDDLDPRTGPWRGWCDDVQGLLDLMSFSVDDVEDEEEGDDGLTPLEEAEVDEAVEAELEDARVDAVAEEMEAQGADPGAEAVPVELAATDGLLTPDDFSVQMVSSGTGVEELSEDELAEDMLTVAAMREAISSAVFQLEGGGAAGGDGGSVGEEPGDADPKVPSDGGGEGTHHAAKQLRDGNGRFAKVGARVRGPNGGLGWVKGQDADGNAIITTDDGGEVTIDSKEMRVASVEGRARLESPPKVVENPRERLGSYLEWAREQMGVTAAGVAPETTGDAAHLSPLFLAEVDEIDTTAVLALLAVIPTNDGQGLRVFERRDGKWNEVPDYVRRFKSVNPPTVVEMDRTTLLTVVEQLDAADTGGKDDEAPAEGAPAEGAPAEGAPAEAAPAEAAPAEAAPAEAAPAEGAPM